MISSSLTISAKLATKLIAKDMVNFELAEKVAPGLLTTGKQWMLESIHNVASSLKLGDVGLSRDSDENLEERQRQQQQHASSAEYLVYNWFESLFAWFQVIILWHEPYMSLCAVSGLLTSFLLLIYFAPRFYAAVMIAMFIYNLNKFWFRHIWPDIRVPPGAEREVEMRLDVDRFTYLHPQLMTLTELGHHLRNLMELGQFYLSKLLQLRQHRPVAFCSLVCSILSCTAYIGNSISGVSLMFYSIALVVTAPGIYYQLLPESSRDWLRNNLIMLQGILNHSQNEINIESTAISNNESLAPDTQESEETKHHQQPTTTRHFSFEEQSLASAIASTTRAQALSLLEHFRGKSFNLGKASYSRKSEAEETTMLVSDRDSDSEQQPHGGLTTAVLSTTIEVPRNHDQDNRQTDENNSSEWRQRKHHQQQQSDDHKDFNAGPRFERDTRGELSPNSSVSLIDSDDEQQDGFVLL